MRERLQKILSSAGVASRREAERMILEGRVRVNGRTVTLLGSKADGQRDAIRVDGRLLNRSRPVRMTLALNKPRGVVSTRRDPEGRRTVIDLIRGVRARLYPVGRLDYNAEGLILLTNDGELAYRLLRPGSVERVYRVKVKDRPDPDRLSRLRRGIVIDGRRTLPARVRVVRTGPSTWIEIGLHEGRKNQVVRMFRAIGHPLHRLRRISIGPVSLGRLAPGEHRVLTVAESARLRAACRESGGDQRSPRIAKAQ
jgi:pseudouridine synthase